MHTDACFQAFDVPGSVTPPQPRPADLPRFRAVALEAVKQAEVDLNAGLAEAARAQAQAQQAQDLSRRCGDEHLQGRAMLVLARASSRLGEHISRPHQAATEAYALLGAGGDRPRQLQALNIRAIVECSSGDIAQGTERLQEGLALAVGAECRPVRVNLLVNLSKYLADAGDVGEALRGERSAAAILRSGLAANARARQRERHEAMPFDASSVGMTLGAEMASEMDGSLQTESQAARTRVSLQLPRRRADELRPADTSR
jgi:hypothetical protein